MTDPASGAPQGPPPARSYLDPPPRRRGRRGAAVGLGLAAAGAGVFAFLALSADAGSPTPEAAVERLLSAVGDEDVIGVLEALDPAERPVLRSGLEELSGELRRLGIASDDLDLGALRGVDVEFEGLAMETEELAAGLAAVRLTGGTVTTAAEPGELPIGPTLRRFLDHPELGLELEPASATEELPAGAPVIAAVDDGDGWHVSLSYSVAEAARRSAGEPLPAFGHGVEPEGAESPEAAVSEAVRAAVGLDARGVVALAAPGEARALHDYAPLFLDDAEAAAAELRASSFRLDVDRLDLASDVDGQAATVEVTGFAVSGTSEDGEAFSASYDGDCATMDFGEAEGPGRMCASDLQPPGTPGVDRQLALAVVRSGERWYLSPTATAFEQVLGSLRALERSDLEDPERFLGFGFGYGFGSVLAPFVTGPGSLDGLAEPGMPAAPGVVVPGDRGAPSSGPGAVPRPPPPSSRPSTTGQPPDREPVDCFAGYDDLPEDATQADAERERRETEACLAEQGIEG